MRCIPKKPFLYRELWTCGIFQDVSGASVIGSTLHPRISFPSQILAVSCWIKWRNLDCCQICYLNLFSNQETNVHFSQLESFLVLLPRTSVTEHTLLLCTLFGFNLSGSWQEDHGYYFPSASSPVIICRNKWILM